MRPKTSGSVAIPASEGQPAADGDRTVAPTGGTGSFVPFFGCMISVKYPQIEASSRRTLDRLGIDLVDIDGFTCCPDPVYFKARDRMGWLTVAARNLALAEEAGHDIVTLCTGCTSTLREANELLRHDPLLRDRVNDRLGRVGHEYRGSIDVRHVATVLRDDLGLERVRESVERPLEGLRVAIHYGCHLLKPSAVMQVDDPDGPTLLEDLVAATGAAPVRHGLHLHCCGKSCMNETVSSDMLADLFGSVTTSGSDCIGLVCPTCFDQLELGQIKLSRQADEKLAVPVLYYLQLLGLAQGLAPGDLGLHFHRIKVDGLVERLALGVERSR